MERDKLELQETVRNPFNIMATRDTKLPFDAKTYIVRALACHERQADILAHIQDNWNITVARKAISHYDPRVNENLDADLKALYDTTAADFWSQKNAAPMNNLNYRQRLRQELYEAAGRNFKLRLEILADCAKDEGGLFAQRRAEMKSEEERKDLVALGDNFANASNEDLAYILSATPDEMIDDDVLQFLIAEGFRKPSPALSSAPDPSTKT